MREREYFLSRKKNGILDFVYLGKKKLFKNEIRSFFRKKIPDIFMGKKVQIFCRKKIPNFFFKKKVHDLFPQKKVLI
jgi:hypothetical protein